MFVVQDLQDGGTGKSSFHRRQCGIRREFADRGGA